MLNLKGAPWPASLKQFRRVEITTAHISGDALFPWPNPCGGVLSGISHISPPYVFVDSPKSVLNKCTMFWKLVNVKWVGSLGTFTLCKYRDTMLCITKS